MNNNECCMTESRRCVADYEKMTREHLLEARDTLRLVYITISGKGGEGNADAGTPDNMIQNAQMNENLAIEIREVAKEINMELFGS